MKLATQFFLPLIMLAQGYTVIVTQKNGEVIEVPADEVVNVVFEETQPEAPVVEVLATPRVSVNTQDNTTIISWRGVQNAASYRYSIDGGMEENTTNTQVTFTDLPDGNHTVEVVAVSGSDLYADSEPGSCSFTIGSAPTISISISTIEVKYDYILADFTPAEPCEYYVGIIPEMMYTTDAEAIKFINSNPDVTSRKLLKKSDDSYFRNLSQDTDYIIFAYPINATDNPSKLPVKTAKDPHTVCG